MKKIDIIQACSDLGVTIDGASMGPIALEKYIKEKDVDEIYKIKIEEIEKELDPQNKRKNLMEINQFNEDLYDTVLKTIQENKIPLTIGGDHSIAIGSSLASIRKHQELGIIWFDSHGDYNTFDTTLTGNIHGLPLAAITGFEKRELSKFHEGNYYSYKNTVIVGARDIDVWEMPNIKKAGITVFTTQDIREQGAKAITQKAIEIAKNGTKGIHVSYDIDLIDPSIAPGVSVPAKNGINVKQANTIIDVLMKNRKIIKSMDLVEFNPLKDEKGKTEKIASDILNKIIMGLNTEVKSLKKVSVFQN